VYAFGAKSGNLLWSRSTGGFVYSSAAVWNKTVYVGSYDRHLYALDAATGDVRWRFQANGEISGPATVLSEVVYFSTLKNKTYGLDARSGKQVWTFPDGRYASVVADPERVYLTGGQKVYALEPES
jgi:outer membrane protein assembly factor BamB